jgi:hypothetical protein
MVLPPWEWPGFKLRTQKRGPEVADVLRAHQAEYRKQYRVTPQQAKVIGALTACRTAKLGGHVYQCRECGAIEISYNACRDRHCPKCEKFRKAQWIEKQKVKILPIPYFHITFTTDHALNQLFAANQKVLFDALFWAVSETLKKFAQKELKATLGVTAVLHTWGQKLDPHVHIHCLVTGGGLVDGGERFVRSHPKFLFDVKELSAAYRDRFCKKIIRLAKKGQLELAGFGSVAEVVALVEQVMAKKWEVFAKPFEKPEVVYEYLSRYVHQVAISNHRILKIDKGRVWFRYHDNKDGGQEKVLCLTGVEFMRRFLWHVLPASFVRIRHYGLHHSSARKGKLRQARQLLGLDPEPPEPVELSLKAWLAEILGEEAIDRCPRCGQVGTMFPRAEVEEFTWLQLLLLALVSLRLPAGVKP